MQVVVETLHLPPFPARFAEAVRGRGSWPADATPEEIHAIEEHGMLPLVYRWSALRQLRDRAMRSAALETLQIETLREVVAALRASGVTALITKGTALAYSIYPAPDLRPRTDVDVLIAENDFGKVRGVFAALGFGETASAGLRQHMFYRVDANRIMQSYDVHLDITNNPTTAEALQYEELRARAVSLPAIHEEALGLSPEDSLLYACVHRVVHHHDTDRLIWLYDIRLLYAIVSRPDFWARAAERRIVTICRHSILLARDWFGGDAGDLPPADEHEPSRVFLDPNRSRAAMLAGDLASLPSWRSRLLRLRDLALPPAEYMFRMFGVRSRALLPLLYFWRGVRGVMKLFLRVNETTNRR
jgi:putative nucleotidyltransferase-like protein